MTKHKELTKLAGVKRRVEEDAELIHKARNFREHERERHRGFVSQREDEINVKDAEVCFAKDKRK